MRIQLDSSASAEGDDAANGIVRRNADRDPVAGNHLDPEAAHPAAELSQHFVALVALHAVKAATVDRHDRALHIYQIILAQLLSFPIKDCATFWRLLQTLCSLMDARQPAADPVIRALTRRLRPAARAPHSHCPAAT